MRAVFHSFLSNELLSLKTLCSSASVPNDNNLFVLSRFVGGYHGGSLRRY